MFAGVLIWRQSVFAELARGSLDFVPLAVSSLLGGAISSLTTPRELWPWRRRELQELPVEFEAGEREADEWDGEVRIEDLIDDDDTDSDDVDSDSDDARDSEAGADAVPAVPAPRRWRFRASLPEGWAEVSSDESYMFRRTESGAGSLRCRFVPGDQLLIDDGEATLARLQEHQAEIGQEIELGQRMRAFHGAAAAGVFATIVRRHPRYGIVAQWLIPLGDVMAFATYQMGSAGIGEHELEEAHQIVVTGSFYELERSPLLEVLLDD